MDPAPVLLHDALANPKAESGANFFLGGEEWFKKPGVKLLGYAAAGIGDGDAHPRGPAVTPLPDLRDAHPNPAALPYRIQAVAQQIGEKLADFPGCDEHFRIAIVLDCQIHPLVGYLGESMAARLLKIELRRMRATTLSER